MSISFLRESDINTILAGMTDSAADALCTVCKDASRKGLFPWHSFWSHSSSANRMVKQLG